jgi:hypothetical protein
MPPLMYRCPKSGLERANFGIGTLVRWFLKFPQFSRKLS